MPARVVHLVRHAEVHNPDHLVYADLPGFTLSELGMSQAEAAADRLAGRHIGAVHSSPLVRASQTAAAIARRHRLTIATEPELTEWFLAQSWKGLPWESLPEARPGELEAYLATPLDTPFSEESLETLASRMTEAIDAIVANSRVDEVVIVSHQDPIQAARLALVGAPLAQLHDDKPRHAEVFTMEPGNPWIELERWAPAEQVAFPPED